MGEGNNIVAMTCYVKVELIQSCGLDLLCKYEFVRAVAKANEGK